MPGNVWHVPQFITARTREDLVRAMLLNNLSQGIEFRYFDIQKDGANWIAWYYVHVPQAEKQRMIVDGFRKSAR